MQEILVHRDGIAFLALGTDENRFTEAWLTAVEAALEEVVSSDSSVLVTSGAGKFFSNGLDLEWVQQHLDQFNDYAARVQVLLARLLTLPVPTVALVNGHAFGAGAMLALAHDFRIMRADRGYFCFPEVDIKIPFTPGMTALIQAKLTPQAAVASMVTGQRISGADAVHWGIVDRAVSETELAAAGQELAASLLGKDQDTLGTIKSRLFESAAASLRNF
ncbi:MAG: enoyl-CoA hydratase/isomerase family protein [Renibacterium sp.]|nr:enoyl-CoA hydratase/isomerase family protein [Renibacterium sp.]